LGHFDSSLLESDGTVPTFIPSVLTEPIVTANCIISARRLYIKELSRISQETNRKFFHAFLPRFTAFYAPIHIVIPSTPEQIRAAMLPFEKIGFPGIIASIDATQILWDKCPLKEKAQHRDKDGHTSLGYQIAVSHDRKVLSCTRGFVGNTNDKTKARRDSFVQKVLQGLYKV
jgi:hypothetical protein